METNRLKEVERLKNFMQFIKEKMKRNNISQNKLANKLETNPNSISNWLRVECECRLTNFLKICDGLNINFLLDDTVYQNLDSIMKFVYKQMRRQGISCYRLGLDIECGDTIINFWINQKKSPTMVNFLYACSVLGIKVSIE